MIKIESPLNTLVEIATNYIDKEVEIIFGDLENKCLGITHFPDDNKFPILITLDYKLALIQCLDILGHELAHAIAGPDCEHNETWQKVYDDLNNEYTKTIKDICIDYKEVLPEECKHKFSNICMCEYCGLIKE